MYYTRDGNRCTCTDIQDKKIPIRYLHENKEEKQPVKEEKREKII